jgi:hypothetical protein
MGGSTRPTAYGVIQQVCSDCDARREKGDPQVLEEGEPDLRRQNQDARERHEGTERDSAPLRSGRLRQRWR